MITVNMYMYFDMLAIVRSACMMPALACVCALASVCVFVCVCVYLNVCELHMVLCFYFCVAMKECVFAHGTHGINVFTISDLCCEC